MDSTYPIRTSSIAGKWYTANPDQLKREITQFVEKAQLPDLPGAVIGILAPHAGYRYSGSTAGFAFRAVKNERYDLVVVLSPYHDYHPAAILTTSHQMYETPLGTVAVDQKSLQALRTKLEKDEISIVSIPNDHEHALEIEIPFLQCCLQEGFSILPLMIRQVEPKTAKRIACSIFDLVAAQKVLIVVSSDFSHFYPQEQALKFDRELLSRLVAFSVKDVFQAEQTGKGFACGLGAIMVGMELTRLIGADKVQVLCHTTSGDITGDYESVVGYAAAAFLSTSKDLKANPS